jgi:hypothetical protein
MSYGLGEQLEPGFYKKVLWNPSKPWQKQQTAWRSWYKKTKIRRERRRAKADPECFPEYKRYWGWEF